MVQHTCGEMKAQRKNAPTENERMAKNDIGFKGYFIIRERVRYNRSRSYVNLCFCHSIQQYV